MGWVLNLSFFLLLPLILYLPVITSGKERSSGSSNEKLVKICPHTTCIDECMAVKYNV